jgi:ribonuclease R
MLDKSELNKNISNDSNSKLDVEIKDQDPFAEREAEKYSNPIPSREFILNIFHQLETPLHFNQLKKQLGIVDEQRKIALRRRLKAMVRDGQLSKIHKNYCLKDFIDKYHAHQTSAHFSKDTKKKKIVGKLFVVNGFNYVVPFFNKDFGQDVLIPSGQENGATTEDLVVLEVVMPAFKWSDPIGKVIKVLGKADNRDTLVTAAIISLDIPRVWSTEVKQQVAETNQEINADCLTSRVDLRHLSLVTIDGEDTKDFDDAVFCEVNKRSGWKLYVAIADVSYYIQENSFIDKQAMLRGNSVYFPGKVVPMLPELFSNDLCSLKPNVDRLCMVCEMHISSIGKVTKYKFYEAIICSKARLTYNQVAQFLNEHQNTRTLEKSISTNLLELHNLFLVLHNQRNIRGAIEFETAESKVVFNKHGQAIDIKAVKRNIAHKIIEECMLCANVATAKFLEKNHITSVYRVHEGPTSVKLFDLNAFLAGIGLTLNTDDNPTPKDYANLLQSIADRKDADVIQMILLRSMCQAMYSTENIGHFGLAYSAYTHFTSPIRRYTDLLVHRHIKAILNNSIDKLQASKEQIKQIAEHCSITERRADDATREVIKACKCQYLSKYVGHKFAGIISGVTKFGLFVEMKDIYMDGLVHINSLGRDYFIHDPVSHKLVGEKSGIVYSLGMQLEVIISKVDLDRRRIDFALDEKDKYTKSSTKKSSVFRSKNKKSNQSVKANKFARRNNANKPNNVNDTKEVNNTNKSNKFNNTKKVNNANKANNFSNTQKSNNANKANNVSKTKKANKTNKKFQSKTNNSNKLTSKTNSKPTNKNK